MIKNISYRRIQLAIKDIFFPRFSKYDLFGLPYVKVNRRHIFFSEKEIFTHIILRIL